MECKVAINHRLPKKKNFATLPMSPVARIKLKKIWVSMLLWIWMSWQIVKTFFDNFFFEYLNFYCNPVYHFSKQNIFKISIIIWKIVQTTSWRYLLKLTWNNSMNLVAENRFLWKIQSPIYILEPYIYT